MSHQTEHNVTNRTARHADHVYKTGTVDDSCRLTFRFNRKVSALIIRPEVNASELKEFDLIVAAMRQAIIKCQQEQ